MRISVNGLQFGTGFNGVLGPQGAGKTRLLQQLASQQEVSESGQKVCMLTEEFGPLLDLTVKEYLCYMAGLKEVSKDIVSERVEQAMSRLNITRFSAVPVGELSRVVKTQTMLAKALLDDPQFLLLDEVLTGLAEAERMHVGYQLSELAKDRVVVLTGTVSHAVEGLFDTVCLMHPEKGAVHVSTNTAYAWVEGKVWEYVTSEVPVQEDGRIVAAVKQYEDGVYVREIAQEEPQEEVSQVTPTLQDAYLWWSVQH